MLPLPLLKDNFGETHESKASANFPLLLKRCHDLCDTFMILCDAFP